MSSSWNSGPAGPQGSPQPPPRGRNTGLIAAAAAVAAAIVAAVLVFALTRNQHSATPAASSTSASPSSVSAAPTVTVTQPQSSAEAPSKTIVIAPPTQSGDVGTADSYVTDIWNVGIVAPADWIQSTGRQLCAAWEAGDTTAYTDQLLLAGGIYQSHLSTFNSITANDLCPNTPGGP